LITAIKQIEAPQLDDKIEKEEDFEYCDVEADRVVDFAREAEIRKSFDEEIIVGESSRVVSPPSEPALFSFGISNEKDMILQHQQQLILQKLQQLNDLQKQQIDSNKPKSDFQPIEIREIHHQETPIPSAPPIEEVQLITTNPEPIEVSIAEKNSIVIDIENPLAGRPLGDIESGDNEVVQAADSGIDLTNYGKNSSSTSSSDESDFEDEYPSNNLHRSDSLERLNNWYKNVYLKPRCCYSCLGSLIFIINFIFFVIASGLVGLAAYGLYILLVDRIRDPLLALIDPMFACACVGIVMFITALSGMIGFCKGNLCLIKFFGSLLIIVCIIFFGSGIVFWVYKTEATSFISGYVFRRLIQNYDWNKRLFSTFTLDQIQQRFECCGMEGFQDWNINKKFPCKNGACLLPVSCCQEQITCSSGNPSMFNVSCMEAMGNFVDDNNGLISATWGGLMLLTIFQFICIYLMIKEVKYRIEIKRKIKCLMNDYKEDQQFELKQREKKKKKKKKSKKKKKKGFTNKAFQ